MASTPLASAPLLTAAAAEPRAWRRPDQVGAKVHHRKQDIFEWSSVLCIVYACFTASAILAALLLSSIGDAWPHVDPHEVWHAEASILMVSSAVVMELCFLMSSSMNVHTLGDRCKSHLCLNGIGDSVLTLAEYGIKVATGLYLSLANGGIVHTDVQATGGPRPVYFARFAQWSVAVPLLVLLSNRSFCAKTTDRGDYVRWAPGLMSSCLYCWAAWIMEVTTCPTLRWSFLVLSMLGAVIVSVDQLCLARASRGEELYGWKFGMLVYQIASFALYAIVFFFGRFGLISSLTEQGIYAYADATVKVLQGAILTMIRNREDLNSIKRWWVAALNATQDLENIVSTACVPVFAIDLEGRIVEWNDSLRKLTGMAFDSVRGRPLLELLTPECRAAVEEGVQHAVRISRAKAEDPQSRRDDDVRAASFATNFVEISIPVAKARANEAKLRNLAMTLVPKSTQEGALAGVVAIGQDLSDLAQLKIVQERKSALIAMLSHEIRSPLHGMVGLTTAMLESSAGVSMRRQLGMVKGCAVRLLDLVTNIMDLAQSEKRRLDNRAIERPSALVDFGAIVDEVHTMTKMAVDKMNKPLLKPSVRFVNGLEGQRAPLIRGDPQKCAQLVYNLVTNACKFTERGSVTVTARHDKEGRVLEVEVADTGRGISREGQQRIFQAFEQEQSGDTRGFQGIGLGLAVCTEIAELHGGELRVASELGHGSRFTASFPCDEALGFGALSEALREAPREEAQGLRQAETARPQALAQQTRAAPAGHAPQTALVLSVDDDEVNQEVIQSALGGVCEVHRAMDGLQALKYLQERCSTRSRLPDMVLLDIQMPGMSGFEVCSEIRQKLLLGHDLLPVVMISARAPTDQTAIESFERGATDFVAKPFNTEVLKRKVMAVLQARAEARERLGHKAAPERGEAAQLQERLEVSEATSERLRRRLGEVLRQQSARLGELAASTENLRGELQRSERLATERAGRAAVARALPLPGCDGPVPLGRKAPVSEDASTSDDDDAQAVQALVAQLSRSRATVRILGSRLDILHTVSRVCVQLTRGEPQAPDEAQAQAFQLQGYRDMVRLVRSQLSMMAQISAPSDLTAAWSHRLLQAQSATEDATTSDASTSSASTPPSRTMPKDIVTLAGVAGYRGV